MSGERQTALGPDGSWEEYQLLFCNAENRCSHEEILASREARERSQRAMLRLGGDALVCLTLNIAGALKQFPLARRMFGEARRMLERQFERSGIKVLSSRFEEQRTGSVGFYAVRGRPLDVKRLVVAVEEGCPAGRLIDADVLLPTGEKIMREALGFPPRGCLVCGAPGKGCARNRTHGLEEVLRLSLRLMQEHFFGRFADTVAACATRSLLYEVITTPKPGLVDRNNSGAHADMDMFTFADSTSVLVPYFRRCAMAGQRLAHIPAQDLFGVIRHYGLDAEDAMYRATRGVNTHKGSIFLLGILAAAAGRLHVAGGSLSAKAMGSMAAEMAAGLGDECRAIARAAPRSHGERLIPLGILGARGEAMSGFASVLDIALPVLGGRLAKGDTPERAGVLALLHLMARVVDTNAVTRTGVDVQERNRCELAWLLREAPLPSEGDLLALDRKYIAQNTSCGGCADLLAAAWMLYFLERDESPSSP